VTGVEVVIGNCLPSIWHCYQDMASQR